MKQPRDSERTTKTRKIWNFLKAFYDRFNHYQRLASLHEETWRSSTLRAAVSHEVDKTVMSPTS